MSALHDVIMDRLRPGWRARAAAQHPVWALVERIAMVLIAGALWYYGGRAAAELHFRLHPQDRVGFGAPGAMSTSATAIGSLLSALLLLILVSMLVNWVQSRIPLLRRLSEHESPLPPGEAIRSANREWMRWALAVGLVTVPVDLYALLWRWA
jgi:hypothetical protein